MNRIIDWLQSREGRKWWYALAIPAVGLLVFYGVISQEAAPLWLALIAAFLGVGSPVMALRNLTPVEAGPESSIDIPEDLPQAVDLDVEQ